MPIEQKTAVSLEKTAFKCVHLQLKGIKKVTQRVTFLMVGPPGLEPGTKGLCVELQRKVSHYLQPILSHRFLNNLA